MVVSRGERQEPDDEALLAALRDALRMRPSLTRNQMIAVLRGKGASDSEATFDRIGAHRGVVGTSNVTGEPELPRPPAAASLPAPAAAKPPVAEATPARQASDGSNAARRDPWQRTTGRGRTYAASPPRTLGERTVAAVLQTIPDGLAVMNVVIPQRRGEVEVDALIVAPHGVYTIEVKDTRLTGRMRVPPNGPPVVDGVPLKGGARARSQARRQAQTLRGFTEHQKPPIKVGWITPILCIHGAVTVEQAGVGDVLVTASRHLLTLMWGEHHDGSPHPELNAATVKRLLLALYLPTLTVTALHDAGLP